MFSLGFVILLIWVCVLGWLRRRIGARLVMLVGFSGLLLFGLGCCCVFGGLDA